MLSKTTRNITKFIRFLNVYSFLVGSKGKQQDTHNLRGSHPYLDSCNYGPLVVLTSLRMFKKGNREPCETCNHFLWSKFDQFSQAACLFKEFKSISLCCACQDLTLDWGIIKWLKSICNLPVIAKAGVLPRLRCRLASAPHGAGPLH